MVKINKLFYFYSENTTLSNGTFKKRKNIYYNNYGLRCILRYTLNLCIFCGNYRDNDKVNNDKAHKL